MSKAQHSPPLFLKDILENTFRKKTIKRLVPDCVLTAAHRFSVSLENHSSIFLKAATDNQTAGWLRRAHLVLSSFKQKFAPTIIHWINVQNDRPILITLV